MKYFKLLRVKHYIKNLLVFLPSLFNGTFFNSYQIRQSVLGFAAFCCASSVVYIINDLKDLEKDKNHPVKCKRPLAAGIISIQQAYITLAIMLGCVVFLAFFLPPFSIIYPLLYLLLNLAYSIRLKNEPLIDVTILSSGFLLRVLYGGSINGIIISNWLFLTVFTMAMFFSLGKRRNEMRLNNGVNTRMVLKKYPVAFLDKGMYLCLALGNVFYALWSMDSTTEMRYNSFPMVYSFPVVLLITLRYCLLLEGESDGDPVEVILHDKLLLFLCALYVVVLFFVRYT